MAKPYDATLKQLVERQPADWLALAGLPAGGGPARVVDADVSAVTAASDKVVLVEGVRPYIAHFEFQSGADPDLDQRVLLYNVLLRWRHRVPVRSVAFLLVPGAAGPRVTGRYVDRVDEQHGVEFTYQTVQAWRLSAQALLGGGVGTLPLALLAAEPSALAEVFAGLDARVRATVPRGTAADLLTAAYILAGLRHEEAALTRLVKGVQVMEESVTYRAILERGELNAERRVLFRLGRRHLGEPSTDVAAAVTAITDVARLEALIDRIDTASTWEQLLGSTAVPPSH